MKNRIPTSNWRMSARFIFTATVILLAVITFSFPTFRKVDLTPKASANSIYFNMSSGTMNFGVSTTNAGQNIALSSSPAVTASSATISGRVMDVRGKATGRAMVSISDMTGGSKAAMTNPFGYYCLANVTVGSAYVIRVSSKHFVYSRGTRTIEVMDDVTGIDFISDN